MFNLYKGELKRGFPPLYYTLLGWEDKHRHDPFISKYGMNDDGFLREIDGMFTAIYRFLLMLRIRIKLLSEEDFAKLLSECNSFEERLYALYFRYC